MCLFFFSGSSTIRLVRSQVQRSKGSEKGNQRIQRFFLLVRLSSMYLTALRSNSLVIQISHPKYTIQWVFIYSELHNYHHNQFQNIFITSKRNPIPRLGVQLSGRLHAQHVLGPGFHSQCQKDKKTSYPSVAVTTVSKQNGQVLVLLR